MKLEQPTNLFPWRQANHKHRHRPKWGLESAGVTLRQRKLRRVWRVIRILGMGRRILPWKIFRNRCYHESCGRTLKRYKNSYESSRDIPPGPRRLYLLKTLNHQCSEYILASSILCLVTVEETSVQESALVRQAGRAKSPWRDQWRVVGSRESNSAQR